MTVSLLRSRVGVRAVTSLLRRVLLKLHQHFYDVEKLVTWKSWRRTQAVARKNKYFGYTHERFGENIGAAYYILSVGGGFRFAGQTLWFRPDSRGRFSYDFLDTPHARIQEADLSHTLINRDGLENLVKQTALLSLSLRECPEVDDWFLSGLHVFGECLQELDLSHCPRVSVGGLASLHKLRKLRRLDVTGLPALETPGLVRILLEEMMPRCRVSGAPYEEGLAPPPAHTAPPTQ